MTEFLKKEEYEKQKDEMINMLIEKNVKTESMMTYMMVWQMNHKPRTLRAWLSYKLDGMDIIVFYGLFVFWGVMVVVGILNLLGVLDV